MSVSHLAGPVITFRPKGERNERIVQCCSVCGLRMIDRVKDALQSVCALHYIPLLWVRYDGSAGPTSLQESEMPNDACVWTLE